ncbi:MICOS complex subunit [Mycena venus]|uniref:MICOS complex subunit n=1 Tax=Mycena venus TaxID=2733690 RepID=A0A8H6Y1W2_9AGAR|nr:MICOS complex subunit [Mycena venus]
MIDKNNPELLQYLEDQALRAYFEENYPATEPTTPSARSAANSANRPDADTSMDELDTYFEAPHILHHADPVQWWSARKAEYPRRYQFARDIMSTPAIHLRLPAIGHPPRHDLRARTVRRAMTGKYREAHASVQGLVTQWIGVENRVEHGHGHPHAPRPPHPPPRRTCLLRLHLRPLSLPFALFLPRTSSNIRAHASELEDAHHSTTPSLSPALFGPHLAIFGLTSSTALPSIAFRAGIYHYFFFTASSEQPGGERE